MQQFSPNYDHPQIGIIFNAQNRPIMKFHNLTYFTAIIFISLIAFYSCQKEPNEKVDKVISSKDPQALSSSIKVWHGIRTQGNPPAEKGNALQLDNTLTDPLYAIAGRYAIIQPQVISGDVAGYYLKINGAPDYFKVDYTKPRNVRQIQHRNMRVFGLDSAGGNLDSAIVIVLPSNLHVPDTICMTYWAYDNTGNVSNPVDVCVIINSLGTDANGTWLNGNWKYTAEWDNSSPHDTIIYNKWTTMGGYYCSNGMLQWSDYPISGQPFIVADSFFYRKADLTYGTNGGLKYEVDDSWKEIDYYNSSCSNFMFAPTQNEAESLTGAWSYNSTTHKLIIVFEFDDAGIPVEEAYEFDAIKVNDKNMILVDNSDPTDPYYSRFEKF
jgi:hypothetical protein